MQKQYSVIINQGLDGYLISSVVELPGCHSQAKNFDTLMKRTKDAIMLYIGINKKFIPKSKFLGLWKVEI